jgi:general secretion pathway protein J
MKPTTRGFTLLEMLIALGFLGLLLVLLGSAIKTSQASLALSETYAERLSEIRTAQDFLRSAVQQALAMPLGKTATTPSWVFQGQAQRLSFIAPLPEALAGGVKIHTLTSVENPRHAFDLQVAFSQADTSGIHDWGQAQRLLHDMSGLRFSYRGLDPAQHQSPWLPTWPWPERLPDEVQVDLQLAGPVQWIPLVIALRANLGASERTP